jgi:hypothetical protein
MLLYVFKKVTTNAKVHPFIHTYITILSLLPTSTTFQKKFQIILPSVPLQTYRPTSLPLIWIPAR